jgi:hypothetical protein
MWSALGRGSPAVKLLTSLKVGPQEEMFCESIGSIPWNWDLVEVKQIII